MTRPSMLWRCSLAGIANGIAMLPLLAVAATIVFFGTAGGWGENGVFFYLAYVVSLAVLWLGLLVSTGISVGLLRLRSGWPFGVASAATIASLAGGYMTQHPAGLAVGAGAATCLGLLVRQQLGGAPNHGAGASHIAPPAEVRSAAEQGDEADER